ncbi:MAG: OstA-like protein, partial [Flavobacteriales bacterium]
MDNAVRRVFLSWGLLVLPFITLAQSIEVEIRRASEISRDPAIVEAQRLVGDVLLSVGEAEVVCDSAWRYPTGRFRLMGRVEATDGPAVLTGEVLELVPDSGLGRMTGREVKLVDSTDPRDPRTLTTQRTTYDFRSGLARFGRGGVVTTETERIESRSGWYDREAGTMEFNGAVTMSVDTVEVRSETVRYRPEGRRLDLPVEAVVMHPGGGIA